MSRGNKWVPLDKYLAQDLTLIRGRPFTRIEAMLSYTIDQDKGKKGTIAGYSVQWSWSRNKVRRFINCIRTDSGHVRDSKRTHEGHPIHFIDTALMGKKDTSGTDRGQIEDRLHDTTIKPNPKPKTKEQTDIHPKPKKPILGFKNYLQEKIIEHNFIESKDKIFEFYNWRMTEKIKGKKQPYESEKGINGLFRDLNGCREAGLIITECLDITMEKPWLTPAAKYFNNGTNMQKINNGQQNTMSTGDQWIQMRRDRENANK